MRPRPSRYAPARIEAAAEQARQLAEMMGEVLEELKEMNEGASPA